MKRLLIVLTLALAVVSVSVFGIEEPSLAHLTMKQRAEAKREANRLIADFASIVEDGRMSSIAKVVDIGIKQSIDRGVEQLERHNDREAAHFFRFIYRTEYDGYFTRMVARGSYDIGDHKGLVQFLTDFYERVELVIGVTIAKALHISDIKSLNHGLGPAFSPCTFPMDLVSGERIDEYERHFNAGEVYYGVLPVVAYWAADLALMSFVGPFAGTIAGLVEFGVSKTIGPKLAVAVFNRACN